MVLVLSATFVLVLLTTTSTGLESTNEKSWDPLTFESQKLESLHSIENNSNNVNRPNRQTTVWGGSPSSFQDRYYPSQSLNGQSTIWGGRGNGLSQSTAWGGQPSNYRSGSNSDFVNLKQGTVWGGQPSNYRSSFNRDSGNLNQGTVWRGQPSNYQSSSNRDLGNLIQGTIWGGKPSNSQSSSNRDFGNLNQGTVWGGKPSYGNSNYNPFPKNNGLSTVWGGNSVWNSNQGWNNRPTFQNTNNLLSRNNGQSTTWGGKGSSTTWGGSPSRYQSTNNQNLKSAPWRTNPNYYQTDFRSNQELSYSNNNQRIYNQSPKKNIPSATIWGASSGTKNYRTNFNAHPEDTILNRGWLPTAQPPLLDNRVTPTAISRNYNQLSKNIPSTTVWGGTPRGHQSLLNTNQTPQVSSAYNPFGVANEPLRLSLPESVATTRTTLWHEIPVDSPSLSPSFITPTLRPRQDSVYDSGATVWGATPRNYQTPFNTNKNSEVSSTYAPFVVGNEPLRLSLPESVATTRTTLWHEIPTASPYPSPSIITPTLRPRQDSVYNSGATVWGGTSRNYQTLFNNNRNPEVSSTYAPFVVGNDPLRVALPESVANTRTSLWHEIPAAAPSLSTSIINPTLRPQYGQVSNSGIRSWGGVPRNYQTTYNSNRNADGSSIYSPEVVKPMFGVQLPESATSRTTTWHEFSTATPPTIPTSIIPQIPFVRTNIQQPIQSIPSTTVWGGTPGNYPDIFNNNQAFSEPISTISPARWFPTSSASPVLLPSLSTPTKIPQIFSEFLVNNYQSFNPDINYEPASSYNPLDTVYAPFSPASTPGPIPQLPLSLEKIPSQTSVPVFISPESNILSDQHSRIIYQNSESSPQGYSYSYAADNGIKAGEEGIIAEYDPLDNIGTRVQGFYEYIDTNGDTIRVEYTADENGFRPISKRIPLITGPTLLPSLPIMSPLPTAIISTLSPVTLSSSNIDPLAIVNMASSAVSDLLTLTQSPNIVSPFPTYSPLFSASSLSTFPPQALLGIDSISTPISTINPLLLPTIETPSELPVDGYTTASPLDISNISTISPSAASILSPLEVVGMVASAVGNLLSLTSPQNPSLPNATPDTYPSITSFSPLNGISPVVPSLTPTFEISTGTYYTPNNAIPPQIPDFTLTPQGTQFLPSTPSYNLSPQELPVSASPTINFSTPSNLLTPSLLPPAVSTLSPFEFDIPQANFPPVFLTSSNLPPSAGAYYTPANALPSPDYTPIPQSIQFLPSIPSNNLPSKELPASASPTPLPTISFSTKPYLLIPSQLPPAISTLSPFEFGSPQANFPPVFLPSSNLPPSSGTYYTPTNALPSPDYTPISQSSQFLPSITSNNPPSQELPASASPTPLPTISFSTPSNLLIPSQLPPAISTLSPLKFGSPQMKFPSVYLPPSNLPPAAISTFSPEGYYPPLLPYIGSSTPQYPNLYYPDPLAPKLGMPSSPNPSPGSSTLSNPNVPNKESTGAPLPSTSEIPSEQRTPPPRIKFPGQKYPPSSVDKLPPISPSLQDNSTPSSTSNEVNTSEKVTYEYLPVGPDASDVSQKKPPMNFVLTPNDEILNPSQAPATANEDIPSPSSTLSPPLESPVPFIMMNDGLSIPLEAMLPISSPSSSLSPPLESPASPLIMDDGLPIPLEAMLPMTFLPSDGSPEMILQTNNGAMDISAPTPKEEVSPFAYLPTPITPMTDGSSVMGIDVSPSSPVSSSPIQDTNEALPEIDAQSNDQILSAEASLSMNQGLSSTLLPPTDNSSPINLMDVTDATEASVPTDGNPTSSNPLKPDNSQPPSPSLEALEEFSLVSSIFNNII